MRIAAGVAPLRKEPRPDAPLLTEAIFGEAVDVFAAQDGWAHVKLSNDGYVGWLPEWTLDAPLQPTHRVAALRSFMFPGPDIKLPPHEMLSLGSRVAVIGEQGPFAIIAPRGYAILRHLKPLSDTERDFVTVAETFVNTPYLWGGKTSLGLDCSGLVQVSLDAAGIAAPRDTDMQEKAVGTQAPFEGPENLRRGDLVFWKGHVAIARGDGTLIHANAHHMAVAIEKAAVAIARIQAAGSEVTGVRRVSFSPRGKRTIRMRSMRARMRGWFVTNYPLAPDAPCPPRLGPLHQGERELPATSRSSAAAISALV